MYRYRVAWTVPGGGDGVSTLHWNGSATPTNIQGVVDAIRQLFFAVRASIPDDVVLSFPSEVLEIENATGELTGSLVVDPPDPVVGTSTATWSGAAGLRMVWFTASIVDGRRVRGATFLTPAGSDQFTTTGTVSSGAVTGVNAAIAAFLSSVAAQGDAMVVYSPPRAATVEPPKPARPGNAHPIVAGTCSLLPATLRSRKQ